MRKQPFQRIPALLGYIVTTMLVALIGMSIFELTKHIIYSHTGSWTMHVTNIAFSALIATTAGLIAFTKLRTFRNETIRERQLRETLQKEIVEREKTEQKLKESEGTTRTIFDTAVDGIITINESATIETFNPAAEQIFGYRVEEVIGKNINILMPTPYREEHDQYIANYLQSGNRKIIGIGREAEGRRKNGQTFPLDLAVSEFFVGKKRYFAGIVRDISDRRKIEIALREQRNFTDAILSTSGALIMVVNRDGRIVRFNNALETLTGYSSDEAKDKIVWEALLSPKQAKPIKALFKNLDRKSFPNEFEYNWRIKDGTHRLISWKNTAILNEQGEIQVIIATGIDITEHRKAEEKAKQHQQKLAHMDRLSVMGEMAANLAHELNQPLVAAYAYSKACLAMLQNGQEKSDKFVNALQEMGNTAERAGLIIHRLRNFIGKQESKKTAINLDHHIKQIIKLIEIQARNTDITIRVELDHPIPPVYADPVQIDQVLLNIVRNGIEAMIDGEQRIITIRATSIANTKIQVTVEDTGPGLKPDQTDEIFNAFHSSKPNGMGMGLAISRSIIEAHDGQLWAENGSHGGTSFHFTIPIAPS